MLGALYAVPDASTSPFRISSSSSEGIVLELSCPTPQFESVSINGESFSRIILAGANPSAGDGNPELPVYSGMVAIPPNAEYNIRYEFSGERHFPDVRPCPVVSDAAKAMVLSSVYNDVTKYPDAQVTTSGDAYLRDFRVLALQAYPLSWDPLRSTLISSNLRIFIDFSYPGVDAVPAPYTFYSYAFRELYEAQIMNFGDFRNIITAPQTARILIIHGQNNNATFLSKLTEFVTWKRQKGFEVDVASTAIAGTSSPAIKTYIQGRYDNLSTRPDFIILLGDVGGSFGVPTWFENESGYGGEGDYPYTYLCGNDALGDAFIGRISVENFTELGTLFNKIYAYEKNVNTNLPEASWLNRMLIIGDPTDSGITCVYTGQYIHEIAEYANPDYSFIENYSTGFASTINSAINKGVGFFAYRGFYGVSGWNPNASFINGNKLSHSVIITCLTGGFSGTSLTEEFIRLGTEAAPSGAVTCIGMATGGTHTLFNNALISGISSGIFNHNMRTMGEALLNGRLYLHSVYGAVAPVYTRSLAHWCNLMGDPTLEAWVGIPQNLNISAPTEIPVGSTTLEISISDNDQSPVGDVCIALYSSETAEVVAKAYTDDTGRAVLSLPASLSSELLITASKHNYKPKQQSLAINGNGSIIHASHLVIDDGNNGSSGNSDGYANATETIALEVTLRNSTAVNVSGLIATLSTDNPNVQVLQANVSYPDISSGTSAAGSQPFLFSLNSSILPWEEIRFNIYVTDANAVSSQSVFYLTAYNAGMSVSNYTVLDDANGILDPGEVTALNLQVSNSSVYPAFDLMGELSSLNDLLTIIDSISVFGNVLPSSQITSMDGFRVVARAELIPGMLIPLCLRLYNNNGFEQICSFNLPIGSVSQNTPLGPDDYGYLIYDDTDTGYPDCPVYEWVETVPALGGSGTMIPDLIDTGAGWDEGDTNSAKVLKVLDLPFRFPFYGVYYDQITVCINGFIALGVTKNGDYRNSHLPGAQGPSPMIAAFWDDLYLPLGSGIYQYYDPANHRYIIQYHNLMHGYDHESPEDFQVIFYDPVHHPTGLGDGKIKIQYKTFNNVDFGGGGFTPLHGLYCTIGIKDHTNTRGLEYTFNNSYPQAAAPLSNERAILITTIPTYYQSAHLIVNDIIITDENANSILEPGESAELGIKLHNMGQLSATGVSISLTGLSQYVTLLSAESDYPDIGANSSAVNVIPLNLAISDDCPGQTFITFQCEVRADGHTWTYPVSFRVVKPDLSAIGYYLLDIDGDCDGLLDPGEEAYLVVNLQNNTSVMVNGIISNLSCSDPLVTLQETSQSLLGIPAQSTSQVAFRFNLSSAAVLGANITFDLTYLSDQTSAKSAQFALSVGHTGSFYDFESSNGNFFSKPNGWQWGVSAAAGSHSGNNVWGILLNEPYPNSAGFILRSPSHFIGAGYKLDFWHFYDMEEGCDGGNVKIQVNSGAWNLLTPEEGYPCSNISALDAPGFSGNSNWSRVRFDLSSYASPNVRFLWTFASDAENQGMGWFIDDVSITKAVDVFGLISGEVQLSGMQTDQSEVWVKNQSWITAAADSTGLYKLYLPLGEHSVQATAPGYQTSTAEGLLLSESEPALSQDFQLIELKQVEDFNPGHTEDAIQLSWTPPTEPYFPVTGYKVMRKLNAGAFEQIWTGTNTSFSEVPSILGQYHYYVQTLYDEGESQPSETYSIIFPFPANPEPPVPPVTKLHANYPNPFNPSTTISFDLATGGHTKLTIFNLRGQIVKTIHDTDLSAGIYQYVWDGKDDSNRRVSSGVYFFKLSSPHYNKTRKMLLLK